MSDKDFNVFTYEIYDKDQMGKYVHWAEGLKMVIKKGDTKIELDSEEIQQLVKSLPRTIGGTYN